MKELSIRLLLSLAGLGLSIVSSPRANAGGFALVTNKSNDVASISRAELKKAFTGGTKQWASGAVVQVGMIPSEAPETFYLVSLLGMSTRELIGRIQEQVFKGEMRRPLVLRSSADCLAFVQASAGAICVAAEGLALPPQARVVEVQ